MKFFQEFPLSAPKPTDHARLPAIIVTGASGFVGSHFVNLVKDDYLIYAIGRRKQKDANVPLHENIRWLRGDIGDQRTVARIIQTIASETTVDYLFHFAGYYDFINKESPEYQRTNVDGTRYILEQSRQLNLKRFIFSSSLAITDFSDPDRIINEQSPPDGNYPYAHSKRKAEQLVADFSEDFPCTIVRLAAIYSDWCEYGPLYVLLDTWLSNKWRARCIAGRGTTAIPYLHVQELNNFWLQIIRKNDQLADLDILIASPNGCVSHDELFRVATKCFRGRPDRAVHIPLFITSSGIIGMRLLGMLTGKPPFERLWMVRYIDNRMVVDSSATQRLLGWMPKPRLRITRRLLFLIENMKSNPLVWDQKNLIMTKRQVTERPGLKIYNAMLDLKQDVVTAHIAYLTAPENRDTFPHYLTFDSDELRLRAELSYSMLEAAILSGDRLHLLGYANYIARKRFKEGFCYFELISALRHTADSIEQALQRYPGLEGLQEKIHYEIGMTTQLITDEIENTYETLLVDTDGGVC